MRIYYPTLLIGTLIIKVSAVKISLKTKIHSTRIKSGISRRSLLQNADLFKPELTPRNTIQNVRTLNWPNSDAPMIVRHFKQPRKISVPRKISIQIENERRPTNWISAIDSGVFGRIFVDEAAHRNSLRPLIRVKRWME